MYNQIKKMLVVTVLLSLTIGVTTSCIADCGYKRMTGTYTNFVTHSESGDLLGIEISVILGRGKYHIVFQSSEGEPTVPLMALADIKNGEISFTLPKESFYREFKGKITPCEITGSFVGGQLSPSGEKVFTLKKGNSFWNH